MFDFFKSKDLSQPRKDWPWTLEIDGHPPLSRFTWEDLVRELHDLNMADDDSFLILEQKDPKNAKNYWFIQSAFARLGPHTGQYIVGVGYGGGGKKALLEEYHTRLEEVLPYYRAAMDGLPLDLSGFEDLSDMLP